MLVHNNSNKLYAFLVAHHQILEHLIIMQQIIDYFETAALWLLNLLKLLLLKWLIYGNDYLKFYNSMEQKKNPRICKVFYKFRKKCSFYWLGYLYYWCSELNTGLRYVYVIKICGKFVGTHLAVVVFMVRDIISVNVIFSIFGRTY